MSDIRNYIEKIINRKSLNKGELKKESIIHSEFEKFVADSEAASGLRIIEFKPYVSHEPDDFSETISFAAKSGEAYTAEKNSEFYISTDNNFALKIDYHKENISVSAIGIPDKEHLEHVLYCRQLNKYYLPDNNKEYNLGKIEKFNIFNFTFRLLLQIDEMRILISGSDVSVISKNNIISCTDSVLTDKELKINLLGLTTFDKCVLISDDYKDFADVQNNQLIIPDSLVSHNTKIAVFRNINDS